MKRLFHIAFSRISEIGINQRPNQVDKELVVVGVVGSIGADAPPPTPNALGKGAIREWVKWKWGNEFISVTVVTC